MKALDLIKCNEKLLLEEAVESKRIKSLSVEINQLITAMNEEINSFNQFKQSQIDGDFHYHAIVAKSLAEHFKGNKHLRVEDAVAKFENLEKQNINRYYQTKNKLLTAINSLIKETAKEAAVCYFDLFEGELRKCEDSHEIIILGDRNNTLLRYIVEELDSALVISGHFAELEAQGVDFNLDVLTRNVDLCTRKNNELYSTKTGKLNKIQTIIDKLRAIGEKVVAFYTYKSALVDIGCNPKGIRDYENELIKAYVPLKKALQKELKIELEDICDVVVNEEEYPTADENYSPATIDTNSYGEIPVYEEQSASEYSQPSNDSFETTSTNPEVQSFNYETNEINPFETSETSQTSEYNNTYSSNNTFSSELSSDSSYSSALDTEPTSVETTTSPAEDFNTTVDTFNSTPNTTFDSLNTFNNTTDNSFSSASDSLNTQTQEESSSSFASPLANSNVTSNNPFDNNTEPNNNLFGSTTNTNNNPFDSNPFDN